MDGAFSDVSVDLVDSRQLRRFIISGLVATSANVAAVWIARHYLSYEWALLVGIAAGFTVSFLMSKIFAFRSLAWRHAPAEAARFLLVYGVGVSIYWSMSMVFGMGILQRLLPGRPGEIAGVLVGALAMTVTSYFGHRFFTYRRTGALD